jgi:pyruvate/2-oxoglutarate dehydrogenase complex dihydrolipoamide acyltransferase (E2) component
MAVEIVIPKLGMTMEEGTLVGWLVADGVEVEAGAPLFNLETEKIEMEVEAEAAGVVRHVAGPGTTLPPGAVVGYILAAGEEMPAAPKLAATASGNGVTAAPVEATPRAAAARTLDGGRVPASPIARRLAKEAGLEITSIAGSGPNGRVTEADVLAAKAAPPTPAAARATSGPAREVASSPIARRLAETLGVDLQTVRGTGPGGRVTKEDVEAAAAAPAPAAPTIAGPVAKGQHAPGERIPIRGMRRVIAQRMHGSLQEMAQLTMGMEVAMGEAMKLRAQLVAEWEQEGIRPTYTDLIIKAVAKALQRHPRMNATFGEQEIELLERIDIGVAVAVEDGLVVPVLRNAYGLPVKEVARESSRLATAAREGKLLPDDMAGQTFSITTLGSADIDFFTPIINPPNVGILGVGRIRDGVAWDGERPVKSPTMTLSLTIDHRAIDGAPSAAFLGTVRDLLEAPYRLLV